MRRWLGSIALVLTAACGGSGGGGPTFLSGSFYVATLEAEADPAPDSTSTWGTALADGGTLSLLTASNTNGVVSVPSPGATGVDLLSGGEVRFRDAFSDEEVLRGRLAQGENVVVAGSVRADDQPSVLALVRRWEGTASTADLAGDYHVILFGFDGTGRAVVGTATFDGAGAATIATGSVVNQDGGILPTTLATVLDYAVDPEGTVNVSTAFGGLTFQGGLDPSGDFAILGGATSTGRTSLLLLVRASPAATAATFQGDYGTVGIGLDYMSPAMWSFTGRLVADGVGGGSMDGTTNTEGTIAATGAAPVPYTVAPDGTLLVTTAGGTLQGGVSPGGDFAILGGTTSALGDPQIFVLVR